MFDSMKNEKGEIIEKAKQTETNTISSGMGSIGSKAINRMYQTILRNGMLIVIRNYY